MKIYLASRYTRFEEMQVHRNTLEALADGEHSIEIVVTSRWINGDHQITDAQLSSDDPDGLTYTDRKNDIKRRFASEDWEDLMEADLVISFTEQPRSSNSRGGRHVEFGAALAAGKTCYVVGPRENVFHCLEQVQVYTTLEQAIPDIEDLAMVLDYKGAVSAS